MINTAGAYILVLIFYGGATGGVAMQEFSSFQSCRAALTQLEPVTRLRGYCIAKDTSND
jgi:hypothetical protein